MENEAFKAVAIIAAALFVLIFVLVFVNLSRPARKRRIYVVEKMMDERPPEKGMVESKLSRPRRTFGKTKKLHNYCQV